MQTSEGSSQTGFVKHRDTFVFTADLQGRVTTTDQPTLASDKHNIKIFLNGVIYNQNGEQLIQGFSSYGVDFVNQLEGSFVIFLLIGKQFYILTDRVNSKKAFYAFIEDVWHISNDIHSLPKHQCRLSLEGIACNLANGL
jgi:asparagine synthetase B (glutamine-hydrolysing)